MVYLYAGKVGKKEDISYAKVQPDVQNSMANSKIYFFKKILGHKLWLVARRLMICL